MTLELIECETCDTQLPEHQMKYDVEGVPFCPQCYETMDWS